MTRIVKNIYHNKLNTTQINLAIDTETNEKFFHIMNKENGFFSELIPAKDVIDNLPKFKNKIRCKICGDEIESRYTHEYVTCSCGTCSIDGGLEYSRFAWNPTNFNDAKDCVEIITERYFD